MVCRSEAERLCEILFESLTAAHLHAAVIKSDQNKRIFWLKVWLFHCLNLLILTGLQSLAQD